MICSLIYIALTAQPARSYQPASSLADHSYDWLNFQKWRATWDERQDSEKFVAK
jgi:hypothetical protein